MQIVNDGVLKTFSPWYSVIRFPWVRWLLCWSITLTAWYLVFLGLGLWWDLWYSLTGFKLFAGVFSAGVVVIGLFVTSEYILHVPKTKRGGELLPRFDVRSVLYTVFYYPFIQWYRLLSWCFARLVGTSYFGLSSRSYFRIHERCLSCGEKVANEIAAIRKQGVFGKEDGVHFWFSPIDSNFSETAFTMVREINKATKKINRIAHECPLSRTLQVAHRMTACWQKFYFTCRVTALFCEFLCCNGVFWHLHQSHQRKALEIQMARGLESRTSWFFPSFFALVLDVIIWREAHMLFNLATKELKRLHPFLKDMDALNSVRELQVQAQEKLLKVEEEYKTVIEKLEEQIHSLQVKKETDYESLHNKVEMIQKEINELELVEIQAQKSAQEQLELKNILASEVDALKEKRSELRELLTAKQENHIAALEMALEQDRKELELRIREFDSLEAKENRRKEETEMAARAVEQERLLLEAKQKADIEKQRALELQKEAFEIERANRLEAAQEKIRREEAELRLAREKKIADKQDQEYQLQLEQEKTQQAQVEAKRVETEKIQELSGLNMAQFLECFRTKCEQSSAQDLRGDEHTFFVQSFELLKSTFEEKGMVPAQKLETISENVLRLNQIEAVLDFYSEKIRLVKDDPRLDDEERQVQVEYWHRLRERDIQELEGA